MATETERKFLLRNDSWRREAVSCCLIRQAYARLEGKLHLNLRVRLMDDQGKACSRICGMKVDPTEKPNSAECIRCGECVKVCPKNALKFHV